MAKKKSDKETEPKKVSTKRFSAFLKNETTHFVIGLISVIFAVYLDRKSTRLNSSHLARSRMPSSA